MLDRVLRRRVGEPTEPGREEDAAGSAFRHLPWIDGAAGLVVGVVVLLAHGPLAELYALPLGTVLAIGAANVGYSSLGLTLGRLRPRPPALLTTLVAANLVWVAVCVVLAGVHAGQASVFGLGHIVGEGVFCATLAVLERRHRGAILGVTVTAAS